MARNVKAEVKQFYIATCRCCNTVLGSYLESADDAVDDAIAKGLAKHLNLTSDKGKIYRILLCIACYNASMSNLCPGSGGE